MDEKLKRTIMRHSLWGPVGWINKIRFMSLALCGEAGELGNIVKKQWRSDDDILLIDIKENMVEELTDVANYAFMLASLLNVDLEELMLKKMIEVEKKPEWKEFEKRYFGGPDDNTRHR